MESKKTRTSAKTSTSTRATIIVPTLLEAVERVIAAAEDSKLEDAHLLEVTPEIGMIADGYGITKQQAVLFCACLEKGPNRIDYNDLGNYLDVSKIHALSYYADIEALVHRGLLRYRNAKDESEFDVPLEVINKLKRNEYYEPEVLTDLDCNSLFDTLGQWFEELDNSAITPTQMCERLTTLYNHNPQVGFISQLRALHLDNEDTLMLTYFCHLLVNNDDDNIYRRQLRCLYDNKSDLNRATNYMRSGKHILLAKGWIEPICEEGEIATDRYKLTDKAKSTLLAEMHINFSTEKMGNMLCPSELTTKPMYYTPDNAHQIDELHTFMQQDQYMKIKERMSQHGLRGGFACLFYGAPGTGKTETVYQLARQTGRHIMVVDVPQIRSKWVGESEKNIKALFDRYRHQVKNMSVAPILLFNEADAIISKRSNNTTHSVDKMENAIQNIILQEMETLDGIMIATTNLETNLDSAFERRFLYKIRFDKPDATVRSKIWQQMIPELTDNDAATLAKAYEFSGGQIENIARKHAIHTVLHGDSENLLCELQDYCATERLESQPRHHKVGF